MITLCNKAINCVLSISCNRLQASIVINCHIQQHNMCNGVRTLVSDVCRGRDGKSNLIENQYDRYRNLLRILVFCKTFQKNLQVPPFHHPFHNCQLRKPNSCH